MFRGKFRSFSTYGRKPSFHHSLFHIELFSSIGRRSLHSCNVSSVALLSVRGPWQKTEGLADITEEGHNLGLVF